MKKGVLGLAVTETQKYHFSATSSTIWFANTQVNSGKTCFHEAFSLIRSYLKGPLRKFFKRWTFHK